MGMAMRMARPTRKRCGDSEATAILPMRGKRRGGKASGFLMGLSLKFAWSLFPECVTGFTRCTVPHDAAEATRRKMHGAWHLRRKCAVNERATAFLLGLLLGLCGNGEKQL